MMLLQQIRCGQIGDFRQRDGALCGAFGIGAGDLIGALSDLELHIGAHALQKKNETELQLFILQTIWQVVAA